MYESLWVIQQVKKKKKRGDPKVKVAQAKVGVISTKIKVIPNKGQGHLNQGERLPQKFQAFYLSNVHACLEKQIQVQHDWQIRRESCFTYVYYECKVCGVTQNIFVRFGVSD